MAVVGAAGGMVSGWLGSMLAPNAPLWQKVGLGGFSGALVSGGTQIALNLASGRPWNEGLGTAVAIGLTTGVAGELVGHYAQKLVETNQRAAQQVAEAGKCSFSADTLVATEAGAIAIGLLKVGDRILAYDQELDATDNYTVTAVLTHDDPTIVYVTLDNETIETTQEHPFFTQERGWVPAGDLKPGEHVRKSDGRLRRSPIAQSGAALTADVQFDCRSGAHLLRR